MWQAIVDFFKKLIGKKEEPVAPVITIKPEVPAGDKPLLPISWDKTLGDGPSKFVYQTFLDNYDIFMSASDFDKIRSDYKTLGKAQLATAFTEFISQIAKYESSWKVSAESVDVGHKDDRNTWSVGLMQMSQVDQKNYGLDLGFSYDDLKTAIPNLKLALAVMVKQIKKHGKIFIPVGESGVYWATIHPGGKYDVTEKITAMTQAMKLQQFSKATKPVESVTKPELSNTDDYFGAPHIGVAIPLLGLNETSPILNKLIAPWWPKVGCPEFKDLIGNGHPWCAVFLDWLLNQVGLKGPGSSMASATSKFGIQAGGWWFGAPFSMRHKGGGFHTGFFLYWIDKPRGIAAILSGNSHDLLCVRAYDLSGNKNGHDEVYGGLRWGKDWAPGQEVSMEDVLAKYPKLAYIGMDANTR